MSRQPDPLHPFALRAIYVRNSTASMNPTFDPTLPDQTLLGQFRILDGVAECREAKADDTPEHIIRSCVFICPFEFRYVTPPQPGADAEGTEVAKIMAEIVIDNRLQQGEFPCESDLIEYSKTSAIFQAWPYWREFCHSSILRMNLPISLMPFLLPPQHQSPSAALEETAVAALPEPAAQPSDT